MAEWKLDKAIREHGWRLAQEWPDIASARAWAKQQTNAVWEAWRADNTQPRWSWHHNMAQALAGHTRRGNAPWTREDPGKVEIWRSQPEFERGYYDSRPDPGLLVVRQRGTNRPILIFRLDHGHRRSVGATVDEAAGHMSRHTAAGFDQQRRGAERDAQRRQEADAERARVAALYDDAEALLADCGFEDMQIDRGMLRNDRRGPKVVVTLEDFLTLVRAVHESKVGT